MKHLTGPDRRQWRVAKRALLCKQISRSQYAMILNGEAQIVNGQFVRVYKGRLNFKWAITLRKYKKGS